MVKSRGRRKLAADAMLKCHGSENPPLGTYIIELLSSIEPK
jgi:hypothetical protein